LQGDTDGFTHPKRSVQKLSAKKRLCDLAHSSRATKGLSSNCPLVGRCSLKLKRPGSRLGRFFFVESINTFYQFVLQRSRYPRRRFTCASVSSACPAASSSTWVSTISYPLGPIRPQGRTKRTVPTGNTLLRVAPMENEVMLDRRSSGIAPHDGSYRDHALRHTQLRRTDPPAITSPPTSSHLTEPPALTLPPTASQLTEPPAETLPFT
jgi:hypothetical protein